MWKIYNFSQLYTVFGYLKCALVTPIPRTAVLNQHRPHERTCNKIATNARWYLYDDFGRKRSRARAYVRRLRWRGRVRCLTGSEPRDTRWLLSLGANGMPRTLSARPNPFDPGRPCPRLALTPVLLTSPALRSSFSFFFSRTVS